jgi:predicted amidohydrolase YtcJ
MSQESKVPSLVKHPIRRPHFPLREAHAHIAGHGREMSCLHVHDAADRADLLEHVRRHAAKMAADAACPASEWLIASGLRVEAWGTAPGGARWPTMAELNVACPGRPCFVMSFDHHSGVVNGAAFAAAGFTETSASPPGGVVERDGAGKATGLLLESAFNAARRAVPEPSREQWKVMIERSLADLASKGFAEVHDLLSPPLLGEILAELDRAGRLQQSVWLYPAIADLEAVAAAAEGWTTRRVRLAGGKVFADGTLNARTAWTLVPFADPIEGHECGTPLVTPRELDEAMDRTGALGLGLAVHAIGDGAVRAVLDAQERALSRSGQSREGSGWIAARNATPMLRIEHAELIDERDVHRFAELGVVCSVQPCHVLYDIEVLARQFPSRLDRVLPLQDLIARGLRPGADLWFGSDVPIVRPDPEDSIEFAVHRRRAGAGTGAGVAGPETRVPIGATQALSMDAAWACFRSG